MEFSVFLLLCLNNIKGIKFIASQMTAMGSRGYGNRSRVKINKNETVLLQLMSIFISQIDVELHVFIPSSSFNLAFVLSTAE